jgi:membrane-associated phospholipid phosphatase
MKEKCLLLILLSLLQTHVIFSQDSNITPLAAGNLHLNSVSSFGLLDSDTIKDRVVRPQWFRGAIVPGALIVAGTITLIPPSYCILSKYTIHDKVLELLPGINTPIDDYLQFLPLAAVFGLKAAGVRSRSNLINQLAITAKAELLMGVIVHGMKNLIPSDRPSVGQHSMPSGHTAQAFVAATILDMEYRETAPWISYAGYAVATTTAIGRMVNDKHWISDVLIGAGIGIFSAKTVYYTHRYHWGKKNKVVIFPAIYKKGGGISFAMIL